MGLRQCGIRAVVGSGAATQQAMQAIAIGEAEVKRQSTLKKQKVAILSFGSMLSASLKAGRNTECNRSEYALCKTASIKKCLKN